MNERKPMTSAYRTERSIRAYAVHLALIVRRRGSVLALYERYDQKRKIGEYHTWAAVERAIVRYGDGWLRSRRGRRDLKAVLRDSADLTNLSTRQLKDEAERAQMADIIDSAALSAIDNELRRRKGAAKR